GPWRPPQVPAYGPCRLAAPPARMCGCVFGRGDPYRAGQWTSASLIVRADLVAAPPEWAPAGLGTSVVIGAHFVVVVPEGVVPMETMVVMVVMVVPGARAAEGPAGGDGGPGVGEAATAKASSAHRACPRGSVAADALACHRRGSARSGQEPDR